jgi:hypothetical protein
MTYSTGLQEINMSATYSPQQIVYTFSQSVNAAGGMKFTSFQQMQDFVTSIETRILQNASVQALIGNDWTPVWGPIVWTHDSTGPTVVADNTMGCYYSASQNLFVIPIAGTDALSQFDWLNEDLGVNTTVEWSSISHGAGSRAGKISTGSATGVQTLLGLKDPSKGNETLVQALEAFINTRHPNGATIAVTGHSLGGALSPCLALYLAENAHLETNTVSVYPSAGPTPGDQAFATHFLTKIPASRYISVYNTMDVIPLAWQATDLATIPSLYNANIQPASSDSPPNVFMGIVALILKLAAAEGTAIGKFPWDFYTQIAGRHALPGYFSPNMPGISKALLDVVNALQYASAVPPSTPALSPYGTLLHQVAQFGVQAVWQHTIAYTAGDSTLHKAGLLDIDAFCALFQQILGVPAGTKENDLATKVVRRFARVDLSKVDIKAMEVAGAAAANA